MPLLYDVVPTATDILLANRLIRCAIANKMPAEYRIYCTDCRSVPTMPVTGECGHTRCLRCIERNGICTCGAPRPFDLHVQVAIQDIIEKMLSPNSYPWSAEASGDSENRNRNSAEDAQVEPYGPIRLRRAANRRTNRYRLRARSFIMPLRVPQTPEKWLQMGQELILMGRYCEAAILLARATATLQMNKYAQTLLNKAVTLLRRDVGFTIANQDILQLIKSQSPSTWLMGYPLECTICYDTYEEPVTTPCGHSYCRVCIEKSMNYRRRCPLCLRSLEYFNLELTAETIFLKEILDTVNAVIEPILQDDNVVPIFEGDVGFPGIACPLLVFHPNYWLIMHQIIEYGTRKFAMIHHESDGTEIEVGTVMEVRDCVQLEDGSSIVSTIGLYRFRVTDRFVEQGSDMARIIPIVDQSLTVERILLLQVVSYHILRKTSRWLMHLTPDEVSELVASYGMRPPTDFVPYIPDGPAWLWWIIAALPLGPQIKIMLLSATDPLKRMLSVSRLLEVMV